MPNHNSTVIANRMFRLQRYIMLLVFTVLITFLIISSSSAHHYIRESSIGKSVDSYVKTAKYWTSSENAADPIESTIAEEVSNVNFEDSSDSGLDAPEYNPKEETSEKPAAEKENESPADSEHISQDQKKDEPPKTDIVV